jgi:hypothetical protein
LGHADDIGDGGLGGDDTVRGMRPSSRQTSREVYAPAQRVGILFTELFEQDDAELREQAVLAALLDDDGELACQVGSLLADLGALVV